MKRKDHHATHGTVRMALALVGVSANLCGQTNVAILPPPGWVRTVEWKAPTEWPKAVRSEGTRHLLYEHQENPRTGEEFTRIILLMENETGVQDSGNLSFHFDPSYQQLLLHCVQVHRAGRKLDRLKASKMKVIQPERALGMDVFTGDHTAVIFVEDLRVGDALEYAYSTRGLNPIVGDHYSTWLVVRDGTPLDRKRLRVVWPADKPLHVRRHLTDSTPAEVSGDGVRELTWDFTNLAAIAFEDYLPASFEPYPYVELSDFDSWAKVVEWALPLYTVTDTNLPPDLQALIERWRAGTNSAEEAALLALQFVQDDLRYTGLELGPDSYRPAPPAATFQKRFGDCKGKALVYCAILRAMNLEAWPALVNTSVREAVTRRLPSPFAFNHVIVKLRLAGRTIWVDPSTSHQGGRLEDRYLPPLDKALVIQAGVSALEDIPLSGAEHCRQQVTTTFRVKDYESPVSFSVKTIYRGNGADNMREELARTDPEELARDYLNFYARDYPGIRSLRPPKIADDRKSNVLSVTEEYEIKGLWKLDASSNRWEAEIYPENFHDALTDPSTRLRKSPLVIPYPMHREQETLIYLPDDDWNITDMEETVAHEAFLFRYHRKLSGSTLRLRYECETKIGELAAEKVPGYLEKFAAMKKLLGDTLYRPDHSPRGILAEMNWLMVVIAGFGGVAALIGATWLWRTSQATGDLPPPLLADAKLQGLGGWLILLGIGICLGPLIRVGALAKHWEGYFSLHVWQVVAMPQGEQYHPLFGPLLIYEVLINMLLLGLNGLAICLLFSKRRLFPRVCIALLVSNAVFILIDELVGNRIPFVAAQPDASLARELFRAVLAALIWCTYLLKSRRVKATFVR